MQVIIELTDAQVDALRHERKVRNFDEATTKEYFVNRCAEIVARAEAHKAESDKGKLAERMAKLNPVEVEAFIASRELVV